MSARHQRGASTLVAHLPLWLVIGLGGLVLGLSEEPSARSSSRVLHGIISQVPNTAMAEVSPDLFAKGSLHASLARFNTATSPLQFGSLNHAGNDFGADDWPAAMPSTDRDAATPIAFAQPTPAQSRSAISGVSAELELSPVVIVDRRTQQANIADYLARRYRRSRSDIGHYVRYAFSSGFRNGVDPLLIAAIMTIESSLNPNAASSKGAKGLMQVLVRVHKKRFKSFGGVKVALEPQVNVEVGTRILRGMLERAGSVEGALKSYVGAANHKHDGGYGKKVIGMRERLWAASVGHEVPRVPDFKIATRRVNLAQVGMASDLGSAIR